LAGREYLSRFTNAVISSKRIENLTPFLVYSQKEGPIKAFEEKEKTKDENHGRKDFW
jgi:hypothetical protein